MTDRTGYKLSPQGQRVMAVLLRQRSGYGREQLLVVALRLACMTIEGRDTPPTVPPTETSLMLTYLEMAEAQLREDPDA